MFSMSFSPFSGFHEGLHGDSISSFETQVYEANIKDFIVKISPDKFGSLAIAGVNTDVASGPDGGKKAAPGPSYVVSDDDDDFMTPPISKRTRSAAINRPTSDDRIIYSNKRAGEKRFRLRCLIEKLRPSKFRLVDEARKIKNLILSNYFRAKYKE